MADVESTDEESPNFSDWFCSLPGRSFFAKIPLSYFEDDFNLFEAHAMPQFDILLDIILSDEPPEEETLEDEDLTAALMSFYEIVHQRYITSRAGMHEMVYY